MRPLPVAFYISNGLPVLAFLFFAPFLVHAQTTDDDALLDSLYQMLGKETPYEDGRDETIRITRFELRIDGSTSERWARSLILIPLEKKFSPEEWMIQAERQRQLYLSTRLFYRVQVYIHPLPTPGDFVGIIELTDGFMYAFNFWPWDVSIIIRHLANQDDQLEVIAGLNNQSVRYDHPAIGGGALGYYLAAGHHLVRHRPGWLSDEWRARAGLTVDLGPVFRLGLDNHLMSWTLPQTSWLEPDLDAPSVQSIISGYGLDTRGVLGTSGLTLKLWPRYRFKRPFGYHADIAAGAVFSSGGIDWYGNARLLGFWRPIDQFILAVETQMQGRGQGVPAIAWADTTIFRSPETPDPRPILMRANVQLIGFKLVTHFLGFTELSLNPLVYLEALSLGDSLQHMEQALFAIGGGLAIGLGAPIGLYYTFGAKGSLNSPHPVKFLFGVAMDLY